MLIYVEECVVFCVTKSWISLLSHGNTFNCDKIKEVVNELGGSKALIAVFHAINKYIFQLCLVVINPTRKTKSSPSKSKPHIWKS